MPSREDVAADATAVLVFDDDSRIPCDRYIMRTFSGLIRRMLEDSAWETGADGRVVIPVPMQPSAPFWLAIDIMHAVASPWVLSLDEVLAVSECMRYLEVVDHDGMLDARLWALLREAEDVRVVVPHASRLLRNPALAGVVMRRLIALRPLWADFAEDVLEHLRPHADTILVNAVTAYAPNFFPPPLVVGWALDVCPHLTQAKALRLASQHGVMYHPSDAPIMLRRLLDLSEAQGWGAPLSALLRSLITALETFDSIPNTARRLHGSVVKFDGVPMASACVTVERGRLPKSLRLTPWLRLDLEEDGRFDVCFNPRRIDDTSRDCTSVQLRVMCLDRREPWRGACREAWYLFDEINPYVHGHTYALAQAASTLGSPSEVFRMIRDRRSAVQLRLDFYYGRCNILHNPFDPASMTKATATFLLSNLQE